MIINKCKCGCEPGVVLIKSIGSKDSYQADIHSVFVYSIRCSNCGTRTNMYEDKNVAIKNWNEGVA